MKSKDVFHHCPDAATKYHHLIPTRLEMWEDRCLIKEGKRLTLRDHYRELESLFLFLQCKEARQKYGEVFESGALHKGLDLAASNVLSDSDRARWAAIS